MLALTSNTLQNLKNSQASLKTTPVYLNQPWGLTRSPLPANIKSLNLETDLCELDYKIIRSLKEDSRKPVADISEEIGVSAKTIRRRLDRMIKNFLIELSIDWYPDASNDLMSAFPCAPKTRRRQKTRPT